MLILILVPCAARCVVLGVAPLGFGRAALALSRYVRYVAYGIDVMCRDGWLGAPHRAPNPRPCATERH
eukprot:scaffold23365_cov115-Isochrysis_galbana.AAC.5